MRKMCQLWTTMHRSKLHHCAHCTCPKSSVGCYSCMEGSKAKSQTFHNLWSTSQSSLANLKKKLYMNHIEHQIVAMWLFLNSCAVNLTDSNANVLVSCTALEKGLCMWALWLYLVINEWYNSEQTACSSWGRSELLDHHYSFSCKSFLESPLFGG